VTHTKLEVAKTERINDLSEQMARVEEKRVNEWNNQKYQQY
jgi:hypothetical protein